MRHVILSRDRDNTWVVAVAQEAIDSNTHEVVGSALYVKVRRGTQEQDHTQLYQETNAAYIILDNGVMTLITEAGFQMELYDDNTQGRGKTYG